MQINNFYKTDYVDFSSYDNLRKIASYIDGFKNSGRKTAHTFLEKNISKPLRVDIAANQVVSHSLYIHGDVSGTLINMAQSFTGSNNINLLHPAGKFGKRLNPEASAVRYISTHKSKEFDLIFKKDDLPILVKQRFEGFDIEPRFFAPVLPMLLVNGANSPSVGFAQKIFARDPNEIIKWLRGRLKGKDEIFKALPYHKGYRGGIRYGSSQKNIEYTGIAEKATLIKVIIKEVPIGYNLKQYLKKLQELKENKKIRSYKDLSDPKKDIFNFEITFESKILKNLEGDKLLEYLKLITRVTENFTSIDENNKIIQFENEDELIRAYYDIRLNYYSKRKEYQLAKKLKDIEDLSNKFRFIYAVVNNEIIINKKGKKDIESQLEKYTEISPSADENNYEYLLKMPIYSLTLEKMNELEQSIKILKEEYEIYSNTSEEEFWLQDLEHIKL